MRVNLVALLAIIVACPVEATPALIDPAAVCDPKTHMVNKDLLAVEALDAGGVRIRLVAWAESAPSRPSTLTSSQFVLVLAEKFCKTADGACNAKLGDSDALGLAANTFDDVLNEDKEHYRNIGGATDAATFFSNRTFQLECVGTPTPPIATAPPNVVKPQGGIAGLGISVRVRGNPSDLYVDQSSDSFKAVQKATLGYTNDELKHKSTRAVSGVIGLGFELANRPLFGSPDAVGYSEIVPYAGVSNNVSKTGAAKSVITSDSRQLGVALNGYYGHHDYGYYWTARPQWLWDLTDKSRLFTTSFLYEPILLNKLNSNREISDGWWYQLILDARFDHGQYTSIGQRNPANSVDFDRIGGHAGVLLAHGGKASPWTWTTTETWLYGIRGQYKTLGQFSSVFSFALDPKQFIGIDLSYVNGRDETTAERDSMWKVSLGFRY